MTSGALRRDPRHWRVGLVGDGEVAASWPKTCARGLQIGACDVKQGDEARAKAASTLRAVTSSKPIAPRLARQLL